MSNVVLFVLGTRPEVIKLAPVLNALQTAGRFRPVVCLTAQHRELTEELFPLFGFTPDYDLDLMEPDQELSLFAARALEALDRLLADLEPAAVVVQGDTTTAMAGALAAYHRQIPLAHVEAGLRTYDRTMPFPEEVNRRVISATAALHFAPTRLAAEALLREGFPAASVHLVGNPVVDALHGIRRRLSAATRHRFRRDGMRLMLLTAHRRENLGAPLERICTAALELLARNPDLWLVCPVHPNPHVRGPVYRWLSEHPRAELVAPLRYDEFVAAMEACALILSDSGGVQEEASVLGKPVLLLREKTERPEVIEAGGAVMVGTDRARIVETAEALLTADPATPERPDGRNLFGDGTAAEQICRVLHDFLSSDRSNG